MNKVKFVWHEAEQPEGREFTRVHAVLVMPDGRVLVRYKNGEARITGGRIDPEDVDMESALKREVLEEINCVVDKCDYLGYLEVEKRDYYGGIGIELDDMEGTENWARMVARVTEIGEPQPDPDREDWTYGRVLAPAEMAREELAKWQNSNMDKVFDAAMRVAQEKGYFTESKSWEYEVLNEEMHEGKKVERQG